MTFAHAVPILRIFDEAKAREFYLGFLGFQVAFEHRFEADLPLYMGISRGACTLHLSEHHGDGTPGTRVRVSTSDIAALHAELTAKHYKHGRPGLHETPWRTRELTVPDPFGNHITFSQSLPNA